MALGIVVVYLAYVGVYQIDHYFHVTVPLYYQHVHEKIVQTGRVRPAFDDMILRAVELPENTSVHVFVNAIFPATHHRDIPLFYQRTDLTVTHQPVRDLDASYFASLPRDVDHVFTFTHFHQDIIMDMIDDYFVITRVEGSPYDIYRDAEMLFAYAPASAPN